MAAEAPTSPFRKGEGVREHRPLLGILLMLLAVLSFTALDSTAKLLVQHYPVVEVVWARYLFNLILLAAAIPRLGIGGLVRTSRPVLQVVRALLLLTATASVFTAVRFLSLADTYAISFVSPIIVAVVSAPLLGEVVDRRRWAAILCGFVGVVVVMRPGTSAFTWAALFPLSMATAYAFYQVVTRLMTSTERTVTALFYTSLVGTLLTSSVVPLVWSQPDRRAWMLMVLTGLFGLIGQGLLFLAFRFAPAATISPFVYSQIVWATAVGYVLFGNVPDAPTLVGAGIVIGSGLFLWRQHGVERHTVPRDARG